MRFIGFPVWDTLIYPLLSVSEIEQFTPIRVARFSPDDATMLPFGPEEKLTGDGIGHFGAFFDRGGRESDYVWGRLDGCEQLLGLIAGGAPDKTAYVSAAREVLAEEEPAVSRATEMMARIRAALDKLEMSG